MAMKKKSLVIDDLKNVVSTVPVGFVGYWMGTTSNIPEGWWVCNGATFNSTLYPELYKALNNVNQLPDMVTNKRFIRCSSTSGVKQGDAMRNIVGDFSGVGQKYYKSRNLSQTVSGPFFVKNTANNPSQGVKVTNGESAGRDDWFGFDASRVVPTASENRPINISAIPIIKHD